MPHHEKRVVCATLLAATDRQPKFCTVLLGEGPFTGPGQPGAPRGALTHVATTAPR
jgi:hypothetical protein